MRTGDNLKAPTAAVEFKGQALTQQQQQQQQEQQQYVPQGPITCASLSSLYEQLGRKGLKFKPRAPLLSLALAKHGPVCTPTYTQIHTHT